VAVRVDALEVGPEPELDHFELRQLGEDPMASRAARDALTVVGAS
jgi:hypothetical protein